MDILDVLLSFPYDYFFSLFFYLKKPDQAQVPFSSELLMLLLLLLTTTTTMVMSN